MPKAKAGRRAAVSHDKGKVLYRGRFVPVQLRPFATTAELFADHLISLIENGQLPPGTELPGRPELAKTYYPGHTINQSAIRDALYILAFRGYVTLGTEYLHTHRYVVTGPSRYTSHRQDAARAWTPAMRHELEDVATFYGDGDGNADAATEPEADSTAPPLIWEPVRLQAEAAPNEFVPDFRARKGLTNMQAFHFMDRLWSARDVVTVHHTWVYPAPELSMTIVNHMASHTSATLADVQDLLPVAQIRESLSVQMATAEQRGDFLIGSKWAAPLAIAVIHRRAYDAEQTFLFGQTSWYRADRFTFEMDYALSAKVPWVPQP